MARNIELPAFGWTPRQYQMNAWRALRDPNLRTFTLAWHRRAGKDDIALHDTAIRTMQRVGNYWHALPEYSQARKAIWDAVNPHTGKVRWQGVFPKEIIKHVDNQTMKLTFINGSTWQVVGSDNYDSLVGTTPVHVVFSEAALADPAAYGFIRPALLENNGTSLHISSVRGRNHFYDLFHRRKQTHTASRKYCLPKPVVYLRSNSWNRNGDTMCPNMARVLAWHCSVRNTCQTGTQAQSVQYGHRN